MEDNKDVDSLYEDLAKELAKGNESEEEKPQVASDQNSNDDSSDAAIDENAEMSEEEISKLTPRAQKRIRDLAEQVKTLADKPAEKSPEELAEKPEASFKSVQDFLAAVEDEPSRKLLEKFHEAIRGEMSSTLAPIEQKNNEARFESEFSKYKGIEGLADHESDLRKTFLRNPNVSVKTLIGETLADLSLSKIKPIEGTPSTPARGPVDTSKLSKDELYEMLETLR